MKARVASLPIGSLVRLFSHPGAALSVPAVPGDRTYTLQSTPHGSVRGVSSDGALAELSGHQIVHVVLLASHVARYALLTIEGRAQHAITYAGRLYTPSSQTLEEIHECQAVMGATLPPDVLDGLLIGDGLVPWCEVRESGTNEAWRSLTFADVASALEGAAGPYEPGSADGLLFRGDVLTNGHLEYRGNRYRSRTSEEDDDAEPCAVGSSPQASTSLSTLN